MNSSSVFASYLYILELKLTFIDHIDNKNYLGIQIYTSFPVHKGCSVASWRDDRYIDLSQIFGEADSYTRTHNIPHIQIYTWKYKITKCAM